MTTYAKIKNEQVTTTTVVNQNFNAPSSRFGI